MKTTLFAVLTFLGSVTMILAQGTIVFHGQVAAYGTNYHEQGMWFRVVIPTFGTGSPNYDSMGIAPAVTIPANIPQNNTPYLIFFRQGSPDDYVTFSLTNSGSFGLVSVNLADPHSPSPSLRAITFNGYYADETMVSQTFMVGGGGSSTFQTFLFESQFADGLVRVEIPSGSFAMDNLVYIPEPSAYALLGLGALVLAANRFNRREP